MRRFHDALTMELFSIPEAVEAIAGMLDMDVAIREALNDAIKFSDFNRYEIAAEMSRLTGRNITRYMLDAYTSDSREAHNFPLRYAVAFEQVTGSYCIMQLLAKLRGCKVLVGDEALYAELGRLEQAEMEVKSQRTMLKQFIESRKS